MEKKRFKIDVFPSNGEHYRIYCATAKEACFEYARQIRIAETVLMFRLKDGHYEQVA